MGVVMAWLPVRHIPPFVLKCFVNGYKKSVFVLYLSLIQLHYVFTKPYLALQNIFSTVCQCPHFNVDETKWRSQTKFIFVFEKCNFSVKIFGRYEACETDPIFTEITLKPTWHILFLSEPSPLSGSRAARAVNFIYSVVVFCYFYVYQLFWCTAQSVVYWSLSLRMWVWNKLRQRWNG